MGIKCADFVIVSLFFMVGESAFTVRNLKTKLVFHFGHSSSAKIAKFEKISGLMERAKPYSPIDGGFSRRTFLSWIGWGGILSFSGGALYSIGHFFRPAVLYEPSNFFLAGYPEDYMVGTVDTRWVEDQKVWIVRTERGIYALISICTHLACAPFWFEGDKVFKCPCHGSVFNMEGDVVSGPARESLFRAPIRKKLNGDMVVGNGLLGIRLSTQSNRVPRRDEKPFLLEI